MYRYCQHSRVIKQILKCKEHWIYYTLWPKDNSCIRPQYKYDCGMGFTHCWKPYGNLSLFISVSFGLAGSWSHCHSHHIFFLKTLTGSDSLNRYKKEAEGHSKAISWKKIDNAMSKMKIQTNYITLYRILKNEQNDPHQKTGW